MEYKIEQGAPSDLQLRKRNEQDVYKFLADLKISYTRLDHGALTSMEGYTVIEKILNVVIPKNLFLCNRQETKFYLLLMPGDKKFLTKELSKQINSARLSFGKEEKMNEYLHCYKGSTSVLGLLFDKENKVNLLIDEDLLKNEYLGFHPSENTSTLKIKTDDLLKKIIPGTNHSYKTVKLD